MKNITNKKIKMSLGILAVLAFVFMPNNMVYARTGYVTPYGKSEKNIVVRSSITSENATNGVYNSSNENVVIYYEQPTYAYSGTSNTSTKSASTKTTKPANNTSEDVKNKESVSALTANALFGSNGFMPSGLVQWIALLILILLLVILARKTLGGEKNYHATPMKHS